MNNHFNASRRCQLNALHNGSLGYKYAFNQTIELCECSRIIFIRNNIYKKKKEKQYNMCSVFIFIAIYC